jgi:hypothetical protein
MGHGRIPSALRTSLGDDATFGLIEVLDAERKNWKEDVLITATDRFERRLMHEVGLLRHEFHTALQDGLTGIRNELAATRVEMLRWSFVFWIGQVAALAGFLAIMLHTAGR